jgi:MFS family permease
MIWGTLSDRLGPPVVVLTGSILLAASLALASRAASLLQFQILFGACVGGAIAAIFAPMMACVTGWFDTHRSLAVSLVSAGFGMAPMTMSPFAAWLVSRHDWRTSLLGMASGPVVGGLIHDQLGDYGWLYLGSFGMGLGAFLIALTFRPFPRIEPARESVAA